MKTQRTGESVAKFLNAIDDEDRRRDGKAVSRLMKRVTGSKPEMWGESIVGFGSYRYRYASGREGEWFVAGFAPRKRDLTLYIMSGFRHHDTLMKRLGRHKKGKSCLYIQSLADVDMDVLEELVTRSVEHVSEGQIDYS